MSAFTARGEKPEWRMIYDDLLAEADFGEVITYGQLNETLGRRFVDNRGPIYRARTDLGTIRKRWLESVPTVGYRVTEAADHVRLSVGHRRRGQRQMSAAVRVLGATDLSRLQPTDLAKWDAEQKIAFAVWGVVSHETRLRRIEDLLRSEGMLA